MTLNFSRRTFSPTHSYTDIQSMFLTGSLPSVNLKASTSRSASTVKGDYCLRFLTFKYDDCDKDLYIGGVYIVLDRMKVKSLNN